jgi:hypothetical protein
MEPGDTYAVAGAVITYLRPSTLHDTHNLMTRDKGKPWQRNVALDRMQIRVTYTAYAHTNEQLIGTHDRKGKLCHVQRVLLHSGA